jgi:hypothetical protein
MGSSKFALLDAYTVQYSTRAVRMRLLLRPLVVLECLAYFLYPVDIP